MLSDLGRALDEALGDSYTVERELGAFLFAAESLWSPIWAALHAHPRFLTLLDTLGLPRP